MKKSFTLIELLVVVAIIGILAAVGTPIFQGFMTKAKIEATRENHNRAKSMITASLVKCSMGADSIKLKWRDSTTFTNFSCSLETRHLSARFYQHFKMDDWNNPYDSQWDAFLYTSGRPTKLGWTYLWYTGTNTITLITNIGSENGGNEYISNSIFKE